MELNELLYYSMIALIVALNAIGVGIGQGLTCSAALVEMNTQPSANDDIRRATFLGMALIETPAVIASVIAVMLLFGQEVSHTLPTSLGQIGIACAMALPGITTGIMSAFPARAACAAIARQPFYAPKITRLMLITLSLIQTPVIFGFIIGLIIQAQMASVQLVQDGVRLLAAGMCLGIGSVGPATGLALFATAACEGVGINKNAYNKLLTFSFVCQALIETPIIFALIISIMLLFSAAPPSGNELVSMARFLGAAICAGVGTIGAGVASGITAASACRQIALQPELHGSISRTYLFAQGLIETCAIYPVIIAMTLLLSS